MGTSFAVQQVAGVAAMAFAAGWDSTSLLTFFLEINAKPFSMSCALCGKGILNSECCNRYNQKATRKCNSTEFFIQDIW